MNRIRRVVLITCAAWGLGGQACAQPTPASKTAASPSTPLPSARQLSRLSTAILREVVPPVHENKKKWGRTTEVFDGLRIYVDGNRIKTRRKKKTVNHGLWRMYRAELVDPETRLLVRIERLAEVAPGRLGFDVVVVAKLDLLGRVARWQQGIRLFSLSAVADAKVRLRVRCELAAHLDLSRLPPDVVLDVEAKDAELDLLQFELRQLSDIKGGAAHQLGKLIRELLEDELQDQRPKLVRKINAKIDKKRDHLRLSPKELILEQWLKGSKREEETGRSADKESSAP